MPVYNHIANGLNHYSIPGPLWPIAKTWMEEEKTIAFCQEKLLNSCEWMSSWLNYHFQETIYSCLGKHLSEMGLSLQIE